MLNGIKGEETPGSNGSLSPAPSGPVPTLRRDWLSGGPGGAPDRLEHPVQSEYCPQRAGWCGSTVPRGLWQIRNWEETAGNQDVD